ncbi:MFS transporter [Arthrobacter sp. TB 23]|uniref:MFS transporter n=1 Tax=Arthrobacter sp. TB 23 TaxID=494419 RepID=UPI0002D6AE98|nr:MFS transporter [Arthrobacter sp. TB 23]
MASRQWWRVALAMFAVGWGANQFAPLLLVYQAYIPATEVAASFGAYALGLIPALLIAARLSDRYGRRRVMRPVLVLSVVASVVLLLGAHETWLLLAGRILAGVASGAAFGPGTAWIKELSADAAAGSGARRAAVSLSAGFAVGPLIAGILAQWLPYPQTLPYIVHILLMFVIAPLVWFATETVKAQPQTARVQTELRAAIMAPIFLRRVLPSAPWVFGAATTTVAVLPGLVDVGQFNIAVSGASAGLTLGTGAFVQPLARRLEQRRAGITLHVGYGSLIAGLLLASVTAATREPFLLIPCAIMLGSAYGMLLIGGLAISEELAAPKDLATVTAVFFCLTYVGFAFPFIVAALSERTLPQWTLLGAATLALLAWLGSSATIRWPRQ